MSGLKGVPNHKKVMSAKEILKDGGLPDGESLPEWDALSWPKVLNYIKNPIDEGIKRAMMQRMQCQLKQAGVTVTMSHPLTYLKMTHEHKRNGDNGMQAVTAENLNELMMVPLITHHLAAGSVNSTPQAMVSDDPMTDLKKYIMSYHFGEKSGTTRNANNSAQEGAPSKLEIDWSTKMLDENTSSFNTRVNSIMLALISPTQIVQHTITKDEVMQLHGYPCNHNIMNSSKLYEITNNMMGNPLDVTRNHDQTWSGDAVVFMGYSDKVRASSFILDL